MITSDRQENTSHARNRDFASGNDRFPIGNGTRLDDHRREKRSPILHIYIYISVFLLFILPPCSSRHASDRFFLSLILSRSLARSCAHLLALIVNKRYRLLVPAKKQFSHNNLQLLDQQRARQCSFHRVRAGYRRKLCRTACGAGVSLECIRLQRLPLLQRGVEEAAAAARHLRGRITLCIARAPIACRFLAHRASERAGVRLAASDFTVNRLTQSRYIEAEHANTRAAPRCSKPRRTGPFENREMGSRSTRPASRCNACGCTFDPLRILRGDKTMFRR